MSRPSSVLALGSFDGVHLGHREIIARTLHLAETTGGVPSVLTYDPLPSQFVHPDFTYVLTPLAEKTALLVELGIADVHVIRFDKATRLTDATDFIRNGIMATDPSAVVVGHDHRFGYRGQGDVALLELVLGEQGIGVEIVPEFVLLDAPVRSTRVRERLLLGHVARAAELLGRHYRLGGTVVSGTGTGHHIGFPTLNLRVDEFEKLVPADGVYAALVDLPGTTEAPYLGVLNIGHRPTFRGERRTIEVHVLDRELPATPPTAVVRFVDRLRPERRFSSPESLARQIAADAERARGLLREAAKSGNP